MRVDRQVRNPRRLGRGREHLSARRLDLHAWHELGCVRVGREDHDARLARDVARHDRDPVTSGLQPGHIDALAWDIRQATADQDRHGVGIITQRREELIAEYDQLIVSPPDLVS